MKKEDFASRLATQPTEKARRWFWSHYSEDMGGEMTIYKRVSLAEVPDLGMLMTPEDFDAISGKRKNRWMAECCCTFCGEEWHTSWLAGGLISIVSGEDGEIYPDYDPESPEPGIHVQLIEGDGIACPMCGQETQLKRASSMPGGAVRRRWFTAIDSVDDYTVVYYWMAHRRIFPEGYDWRGKKPWNAYVVEEDGSLSRYVWKNNRWMAARNCDDAAWVKYVSGDSMSTFHHMLGGWDCPEVLSQAGKTGERTGVAAYMRAGGNFPVAYLKTWKRHWQLCKLAESPFAGLLGELVVEEYNQKEVGCLKLEGLDLGRKKPWQMLGMDRSSYRALMETGRAEKWHKEEFRQWRRYQESGGGCTAWEFDGFWCRFGIGGMEAVMEARTRWPWLDLPKIGRYLDVQRALHPDAPALHVTVLTDTWTMMMALYGRELQTDEEMWPRDLTARHNAMETACKIENGRDSDKALMRLKEFREVWEEMRALEWTDGTWRVVVPRNNLDLIREGATLRHCVDSYADNHISGRQRVFFIRHHRRPERSYFTLSVKMDGDVPVQMQLHGYGNEAHGPNKQYRHKKDKRIQPFVDKWMREVLMPWWRKRQQEEKERKTA